MHTASLEVTPSGSIPVVTVQAAVLHRFCDMLRAYRGGVVEIGDRARNAQNAVVRAGGKAHAAYRHFKRSFAGIVQSAVFAQGS